MLAPSKKRKAAWADAAEVSQHKKVFFKRLLVAAALKLDVEGPGRLVDM